MAKKHTLRDPKAPKAPRPKYVMPAPNDDIEAYGWDMGKLRYPDEKSDNPKHPDPGVPIFTAPDASWEMRQRYGHDLLFLCPQYLQLKLDQVQEVRDAALAAHEAGYTKESLDKIEAAVATAFTKKILPEIAKNFGQVSGMIAQFYAARIAHIKKFGKP